MSNPDPPSPYPVSSGQAELERKTAQRVEDIKETARGLNGPTYTVNEHVKDLVDGGITLEELNALKDELAHTPGGGFERLADRVAEQVDKWAQEYIENWRQSAGTSTPEQIVSEIQRLDDKLSMSAPDYVGRTDDVVKRDIYQSELDQRDATAAADWARPLTTEQLTAELQTLQDKADFGQATREELSRLEHGNEILQDRIEATIDAELRAMSADDFAKTLGELKAKGESASSQDKQRLERANVELDRRVQDMDRRLDAALQAWAHGMPEWQLRQTIGELTDRLAKSPSAADRMLLSAAKTELGGRDSDRSTVRIDAQGRQGTEKQLEKQAYAEYVRASLDALRGNIFSALTYAATGNPELSKAVGGVMGALGGIAKGRNETAAIRPPTTGRDTGADIRTRDLKGPEGRPPLNEGARSTGDGGTGKPTGADGAGRIRQDQNPSRDGARSAPVRPDDTRWGGADVKREPFTPGQHGVRESAGASPRGADFQAASAQTQRSTNTAIRADTAEMHAYRYALSKGEIGIERPQGANNPGRGDFITAVENKDGSVRLVVTDVKQSGVGKFPSPATAVKPEWQGAVRDAVSPGRLDVRDANGVRDLKLEAKIQSAAAEGRIEHRQLNVDFSKPDVPVTEASRNQKP